MFTLRLCGSSPFLIPHGGIRDTQLYSHFAFGVHRARTHLLHIYMLLNSTLPILLHTSTALYLLIVPPLIPDSTVNSIDLLVHIEGEGVEGRH